MPTTIVAPITKESLMPFAKLGKANDTIRTRIVDLLFALVQTDDPAKVKALCKAEIEWLNAEYEKSSTRTTYASAYRKSIQGYFSKHPIPAPLETEKKTIKGMVINHLAMNYLAADAADHIAARAATTQKTETQRDNLTGFDAAAALAAMEEALQADDWRQIAAGLMLACQCRPSDLLKLGEFKALTKYTLEFKSRAKARGKVKTGVVFCLADSATFIDAFSRLRRDPEVIKAQNMTLVQIDSAKNSQLNRGVKNVFGEVIPAPYGENILSCKNLRAAGVNVAYWLYGKDNQALGRFAQLQLLHDNPGTAANYEDFYCVGDNGKRLLEIGVRKDEPLAGKPLSEKRSSLSLDKQLLAMVSDAGQWGEGSHADRLERIIARAKQADRLERQLARECEKRQRLEIELKRLQASLSDEGEATVEDEPDIDEPVTQHQADEASGIEDNFDDSDGFDWRSVPNEVLNGDRRHDAYPEKLRRSVEAVQEYNAGRDLSEQFSITGSLLRQLAKVKPGLVKEWMEDNSDELQFYADQLCHGARQNTGKPEPRSVIKWSEEAYGGYDWQ
ncbi:MAG: protelomerase family protein [Cyanobacteria bacterium J06634_6]